MTQDNWYNYRGAVIEWRYASKPSRLLEFRRLGDRDWRSRLVECLQAVDYQLKTGGKRLFAAYVPPVEEDLHDDRGEHRIGAFEAGVGHHGDWT